MIPRTYLIGKTQINYDQLNQYLEDTDQKAFLDSCEGLGSEAILTSFYAKLCYKSLVEGKNENISKVRSIEDNIKSVIKSGHGSVLEHVVLNFVTTNCSRVFTHELVRHRVGTAYSQTSGRYVRSDQLDMVLDDPILDTKMANGHTVKDLMVSIAKMTEAGYNDLVAGIDWDSLDFNQKKKLTSALRRILPNGQANEIGWSANIRALRHMIRMRTSRHAEWEIRQVFNDVYHHCKREIKTFMFDAVEKEVDGLLEVTFTY